MRRSLLSGFPLVVIGILMAASSPLHAADLQTYVALKAGVYSPQEDPFEEFDDGWSGEIAFGGYLSPNFALELGVGYFEFDGQGAIVAPGPIVIPADAEISVIPVTVNLKYLHPVGKLEPYVEGGAGVYVADADLSGGGIELSDRYTNIGAHLGLGATLNITENLFLGVEGRYLWVAEHKFRLGAATQDVELDGYIATVNVGYKVFIDGGL